MSRWTLVYSRQAQKDAKKLTSAGLKPKAQHLLDVVAEDPFAVPPRYEKLVGDLAGLLLTAHQHSAPPRLRGPSGSARGPRPAHVDPLQVMSAPGKCERNQALARLRRPDAAPGGRRSRRRSRRDVTATQAATKAPHGRRAPLRTRALQENRRAKCRESARRRRRTADHHGQAAQDADFVPVDSQGLKQTSRMTVCDVENYSISFE